MTRRSTGFSDEVKQIVLARSSGMCEVMAAGCTHFGAQYHHRRPRGMGGTRRLDTNWPSAALYVCMACHAYLESHRAEALDNGWLVRQGVSPGGVPVLWRGCERFLDDDGTFEQVRDVG